MSGVELKNTTLFVDLTAVMLCVNKYVSSILALVVT